MPFYDRACRMLQIPLFDRSFDQPHEEGRPPWVIDGAREFFSSPRYFSPVSGAFDKPKFDEFRTAFASAPNISVYLNANVTRISRHRRRPLISDLNVVCLNGKRHLARGRSYVLATGGIENVRMLLTSELGNESGLLGRHFMGHVTYGQFEDSKPISMLAVSDAAQSLGLYTDNARDRFHCVIGATLEAQRRFSIGNVTATLVNATLPPSPENEAIRKLAAALDRNDLVATAKPAPAYFMAEHMPNPESRIRIDPANVDALGMPRVRLEWVYTARDLDNVERGIAAMATVLGETRSGRLCWSVPRNELLAGFSPSRHHMGATRMSVDAGEGVVDPQCKLHGIDNLYVAGCSVFPTSAIINPTLTIFALAMRMSDHLKHELGLRA